jgi:hypothetical protein
MQARASWWAHYVVPTSSRFDRDIYAEAWGRCARRERDDRSHGRERLKEADRAAATAGQGVCAIGVLSRCG